jgi:dihydrolipoamide dehydrogenase
LAPFGGSAMLLKKNKVDVIWGEAAIEAAPKGDTPGAVVVKETFSADRP